MIVYTVYIFYDWWPFCLVAMAIFNFGKGLFQITSKTTEGVVGCGEGVGYLTLPRRPTDIGFQLGKTGYPFSR